MMSENKINSTTEEQQDDELHNYAILCKLLLEGGTQAMRLVFDNVNPPITLNEKLLRPGAHKLLRRLKAQNIIDEAQWEKLYPQKKRVVSSQFYDPVLVMTLLKNMCHLSPPYPNGWEGMPVQSDKGISADLARINYFRKYLSTLDSIPKKEYQAYVDQITDVLVRLGGAATNIKIQRVTREQLSSKSAKESIEDFKKWNVQAKEVSSHEAKVDQLRYLRSADENIRPPGLQESLDGTIAPFASPTSMVGTSRSSSTYYSSGSLLPTRSAKSTQKSVSFEQRAFSKDDRAILVKFYKPLTEAIRSETVLPKLVQAGILSHEERNSLNLATRNVDRMKGLLELLPRKNANAFGGFCEVLKFKYTTIYDQLMKAKQQALLQQKQDELSECQRVLKTHYQAILPNICPIPWHPKISMDLQEFYIKPAITDSQGRTLTPGSLFSPHSKNSHPSRVLIEGSSGTGKSILGQQTTLHWAKDQSKLLKKFKMVFFLDLTQTTGSLIDTIMDQSFPPNFTKSKEDITKILEANQESVLFILDGFGEYLNAVGIHKEQQEKKWKTDSIWCLVYKRYLEKSSVLMLTSETHKPSPLARYFDTKLLLLGIASDQQENLIDNYARVLDIPTETYATLLAKVTQEYETTIRILSQNPLFCLCMCLICEMHGSLNFGTKTIMLQNFMDAVQKLYCTRNQIMFTGDEMTQGPQNWLNQLEQTALKTAVERRIFFYVEEKEESGESDMHLDFHELGLTKRSTSCEESYPKECYQFAAQVFQDYLAAQCLSKYSSEDLLPYKHLLEEQHLADVTKMFCGLLKSDSTHTGLKDLFQDMGNRNRAHWKGIQQVLNGIHPKSTSEVMPQGRLSDFKLSLECLNECVGRHDLQNVTATSIPRKLYMRDHEVPQPGYIGGLGYVLEANNPFLTELDLKLDHISKYHEYTFMNLAHDIEQSIIIETLKLRWSSPDILALFLANIFGANSSLRTVKCFDECKKPLQNISAIAWSNLGAACQNMLHIEAFTFFNCKSPALVTSVLHNLPMTVEDLNLSGSTIDLVSAQELAQRLEKSQTLKKLNLRSAVIKRGDFLHLSNGLSLSHSLSELSLAKTTLDTASFKALAEAIKFSKSLNVLDLGHTLIGDDSCKALGHALSINQSITILNLKESTLSLDGIQLILKLKSELLRVSGAQDKTLLEMQHSPGQLHFSLPSIQPLSRPADTPENNSSMSY